MKNLFILLMLVGSVRSVDAQINTTDLFSKVTTDTARIRFTENGVNLINKTLLSIEDSIDTKKLEDAFWLLELMDYKNDNVSSKLHYLLSKYNSFNPSFQQSLIEVIYTLYPKEFTSDFTELIKVVNNRKIFAMIANYLANNGYNKNSLIKLMKGKFYDFKEDPILFSLTTSLQQDTKSIFSKRPPLKDLLNHKTPYGNKPVFYSIQRHNRDYQGILIIKDAKGNFVLNKDGSLFYVKQLARSITNMPGYITNGNTPQGVFSYLDLGNAKNPFIGPSRTLDLALPFEVNPTKFFHNPNTPMPDWNVALYKSLLPESWQNYQPIFEAYYAGKAGRYEIISHGTTVNPEYYLGKPYFPNTPTYGCLCTMETWNKQNGQLLQSDQVEIINKCILLNIYNGYLIVVELDDQNKDVTIDEIIEILK